MKKIAKFATVMVFIIAFMLFKYFYFEKTQELSICENNYNEFKKDYNREVNMMMSELEIRDTEIKELKEEVKELQDKLK